MTVLGIALVILGVVLLAAEAHLPTAGALGVAGVVALVGGTALVAAEAGAAFVLPVAVVAGLMAAGAVVVAGRKGLRAGRLPARTGPKELVGHVGVVRAPLAPVGQVAVDGALWRARPAWDSGCRGAPRTGPERGRRGGGRAHAGRPPGRGVGALPVIVLGLVILTIAVILLAVAGASIRVLREYERGVVFRLGRLIGEKGPGLVLLIPVVDRLVKVSLRTVTLNIPPQEVITRDNVPARVTAVAYFRVVDPDDSVVKVEDFLQATSQIAQTTLRSVLGKAELDTLLAERDRLNEDLQQIIDEQTEPWGVKVTTVEIKDVEIPQEMQRSMARQAEAERTRRAKVINAEGEFQAAQRLLEAADVISQNPATMQLRYLQTLGEIGVNQNSTVVFPLPLDLVRPLLEGTGGLAASVDRPGAAGDGEPRQVGAGAGAAGEGAMRQVGAGAAGEGATPQVGAGAGQQAGEARQIDAAAEAPELGPPASEAPLTQGADRRSAPANDPA